MRCQHAGSVAPSCTRTGVPPPRPLVRIEAARPAEPDAFAPKTERALRLLPCSRPTPEGRHETRRYQRGRRRAELRAGARAFRRRGRGASKPRGRRSQTRLRGPMNELNGCCTEQALRRELRRQYVGSVVPSCRAFVRPPWPRRGRNRPAAMKTAGSNDDREQLERRASSSRIVQ